MLIWTVFVWCKWYWNINVNDIRLFVESSINWFRQFEKDHERNIKWHCRGGVAEPLDYQTKRRSWGARACCRRRAKCAFIRNFGRLSVPWPTFWYDVPWSSTSLPVFPYISRSVSLVRMINAYSSAAVNSYRRCFGVCRSHATLLRQKAVAQLVGFVVPRCLCQYMAGHELSQRDNSKISIFSQIPTKLSESDQQRKTPS